VAVVPDQRSQQVRVHGKSQGRGAVVVGQFPYHRADLGMRRPATAQLLGHGSGKEPVPPHRLKVLGYKRVFCIVLRRARAKVPTKLLRNGDPFPRITAPLDVLTCSQRHNYLLIQVDWLVSLDPQYTSCLRAILSKKWTFLPRHLW
jgi:hypothetical protein